VRDTSPINARRKTDFPLPTLPIIVVSVERGMLRWRFWRIGTPKSLAPKDAFLSRMIVLSVLIDTALGELKDCSSIPISEFGPSFSNCIVVSESNLSSSRRNCSMRPKQAKVIENCGMAWNIDDRCTQKINNRKRSKSSRDRQRFSSVPCHSEKSSKGYYWRQIFSSHHYLHIRC
jgi:hypothetical protein